MKLSKKYLLFPISSLLLFAAGCGCNSKDYAADGAAALEKGDYAGAASSLDRVGKDVEKNSAYFYNLGLAKARSGDLAGAVIAFDSALDADHANIDALEYKAVVLREKGDCISAHETLDRAIGLAKDAAVKARVLNSFAVTEHKLGMDELAVIRLGYAMTVAPEYAATYFNLAKIVGETFNDPEAALFALAKFDKYASADDPMRKNVAEYTVKLKIKAGGAEFKGKVDKVAAAKLAKEGDDALKRQKWTLADEKFASAAALAPDMLEYVYNQAKARYCANNYEGVVTLLAHSLLCRWTDNADSYKLACYSYCGLKRFYEAKVCGEALIGLYEAAGIDSTKFKEWFRTIPNEAFRLDK